MDVAILEPAVGRDGRPHHDEVVAIARALVAAGAKVTVHAHRTVDEAIAARFAGSGAEVAATFSYHDFSPRADQNGDPAVWREIVRRTTEELAALPEPDIAFWPALLATQAQALARAPRGRIIVAGLDGQIAMREPFSSEIFAGGIRAALRLGPRFRPGVYDRRLVEAYRPFLADTAMLPLPVPFHGGLRRRPRTTPLRVGIVGAMRPERGIGLLPALVDGLLGRGLEVVVQSSFHTLPALAGHPRLTLLDYVADFPALVADCDLIVWPSNPRAYVYRCSGVVWVAIASGVPLVMPSLCLPAQIAAERGAASFYHRLDAAAILRAVDRALDDHPGLAALATARAEQWNRDQGPGLLAETVLALA